MATPEQTAYMQSVRLRQINYMRQRSGKPLFASWAEYQAAITPPAPTPTGPPPTAPSGPTEEQRDARVYLSSLLDTYGLGSLTDWAWDLIVQGASDDEVIQALRERPEYAARFPGMAERRTKGYPAISEAEYLAYERQAVGMFRAAGLPEGFYDQPSDFASFIGRDVSVAELSQRVQIAEDAAYNAPAEVRDELQGFYGLGPGDLTAYWLDPDKALPLLERRYRAASTSATARQTGFGGLSATEAEGLVAQGVTEDQARQGFSDLARGQELFRPLDAGESAIGRESQLGATFGQDAAAKQQIENRQKRRTNQFAEGGGFTTGREGYSGLGG